jgi:tetratricopeptide (TPR) repeat protein
VTRLLLCAAAVALLAPAAARAHDSPEHVIEDLTRLMDKRGRTPELLYRRACEHRALRRLDPAAADLRAALALDPRYLPACLELGRVQLAQGRPDDAWASGEQARRLAATAVERGRVHMLRAEVHTARGRAEAALAECADACRLVPGEVEWLLRRSQLHRALGRHADRIDGLEAACQANPSVVLKTELIDARIDAGRAAAALPEIERELADSRWQSSWLIRRARARRQLGDASAAEQDLRAAVAEINQRLHPARPDVTLLADRGLAHALLGDTRAAHADLAAARALKADAWVVDRLASALAAVTR